MGTFQFDSNEGTPIYFQLYRYLREKIMEGEFAAGDYLPSENEMTANYKISRITVRRAVADLESEGYVRRERGRGTVVLKQSSAKNLDALFSLHEMAENAGKEFSCITVSAGFIEADARVCRKLQVPFQSKVFNLKRLGMLDKQITILITSYIPYHEEWECVYEKPETINSVYDRLEKAGIVIDYATETWGVKLPTAEVKHALFINDKSPVVHFQNTTYSDSGKIVEYSESDSIYSAFSYTVTKRRQKGR